MKKTLLMCFVFVLMVLPIITVQASMAQLATIKITTNKINVNPGETVTVDISFGESLGSYTFDIAYDNNLFEFVSVEGGTPNDTGNKVRVVYYDSTGGNQARTFMNITFRAKENITTSNPTDFAITAEGLANADATKIFDDISVPIIKNVVVEPKYEDYKINLDYSGDIIKSEEKDMSLIITSSMGKPYDHARIIAEATTPTGATVQLLGTDELNLEHDLIQNGWGDASGYKIGGQNMRKQLDLRGIFDTVGNYQITIKLIDRDQSDMIVAKKTFDITVKEKTEASMNMVANETVNQTEIGGVSNLVNNTNTTEKLPTTLPKTGANMYIGFSVFAILVIVGYVYFKNMNSDNF